MAYILAIDSGTTSCRSILFNERAEILAVGQREFTQHYPQPGWVEHDASEIWQAQLSTIREVLDRAGIHAKEVATIGITNQRETVVAWSRSSHKPLAKAIVWQDRRTAPICDQWKKEGKAEIIQKKTGLVLDAYFSGTKMKWLIENNSVVKAAQESGDLCFGTIDSWIIYKLTNGATHVTDVSNASRTLLFNIHDLKWESDFLEWAGVQERSLPTVKPSSARVAVTDSNILNAEIPISGIAGDQQAALFGQQCFTPGMAKNTYGTGCFMLMNTGTQAVPSHQGLLTTIAWQIGDRVEYALEGSVFIAGAAVQWLRDELKILEHSPESQSLAESIPDNQGVYLVPAFAGLGAPYWDMEARASVFGMTRGSGRAHITRAALESIAYQVRAVLEAMEKDTGIQLSTLRVDGGASLNDFLMQWQADQLNIPIERPVNTELTALGAAYLAGIAEGIWKKEELTQLYAIAKKLYPQDPDKGNTYYKNWQQAVALTRQFKPE